MKLSRFVYQFLSTAFLFALFLNIPQSFAQTKTYSLEDLPRPIKNAVRVSSRLEKSALQSEFDKTTTGNLTLALQLETLNDYYIYEDSVIVETLDDPHLQGAHWVLEIKDKPSTQTFLDPVSKKLKKAYRGQSFFLIQASLSGAVSKPLPPDHKIPLRVRFQACSTSQCLLPAWLKVETLSSPNTKQSQESSTANFSDKINQYFREALENNQSSRLEILFLLMIAGLLTSFTPCVYPLYPITLGIFGRWEKTLHFPAIFLVAAYCVGMTLSYASLGVFTLLTGSLFASITQTPLFLIGIGSLILISAIFFSGLLNFPMPSFLQNYMSHIGDGAEKKGTFASLMGALGMGASLGIVASPCVGPVLVALLAWLSNSIAAGQSSPYEGFLLLSAFGAGMSLPFLILGHLILKMKMKIQIGRFTPLIKYLGTALLLASSLIFLIPGFQLLNPKSENAHADFKFETFTLETAPSDSWKVLDFRADWCTACIQLERETFSNPIVSTHFENKVWSYVQVDFTNIEEKQQKIAEQYSVLSLPTVLFVSPSGEICKATSLHTFESARDFDERLRRTKESCAP
ncbi:hypothetical protein GW915_05275 [bacterium]|nr:hypothetical protein [bacterium]